MYIIKILLIFYWAMILKISAHGIYNRACTTTSAGYAVCKSGERLISVTEKTNLNSSLKLKTLIIDDQDISIIDKHVFKNLTIETLELNLKKQIISLEQESLSGLSNLKNFKLKNGIVKVEDNIFKLISNNLESLSLTITPDKYNVFKYILLNFPKLKTLQIFDCNFLPTPINKTKIKQDLPAIKRFDMTNGNIPWIPTESFLNMKNLETLNLVSSKIKSINPHVFNHLDNLVELSLESNNITTVPKYAFINLIKLNLLNLKNNQIKDIDNSAFMGLGHLAWLSLKNNQLAVIKPGTFQDLQTVQLDLSNNNISYVLKGAFRDVNLKKIYLHNNFVRTVDKINWELKSSTQVYLGISSDD